MMDAMLPTDYTSITVTSQKCSATYAELTATMQRFLKHSQVIQRDPWLLYPL